MKYAGLRIAIFWFLVLFLFSDGGKYIEETRDIKKWWKNMCEEIYR